MKVGHGYRAMKGVAGVWTHEAAKDVTLMKVFP